MFRQKSHGPKHNYVWLYKVTQKQIPVNDYDIKVRGAKKGETKPDRRAKLVEMIRADDVPQRLPKLKH